MRLLKIKPVPHGLEDLIGKSGPRTPGLHMSSIYNALYQELEPKRFVKGSAPDPLRLEAGLAFESFLEEAFRARLNNSERPPELEYTEPGFKVPILYNPDMIIFNGSNRLGEIKLTWMSSSAVPREATNGGFPPKFDKYFDQMMSYCYMLDMNQARLIGFFVNGDYKYYKQPDGTSKPCGPELLAWDIEFTKREIAECWAKMIGFAKTEGML